MARRTFKFDDHVFVGFNKDFSTPHTLVLVKDEDVMDVWAIDGVDISKDIDNLLNYLSMSQSLAQIMGTYSEEGFRGFICPKQFVSAASRFN